MKNEKYEPAKFETWQELAKFVIDGGEVYYGTIKVTFDGCSFNIKINDAMISYFSVKKQPTLEELIAIKPRLCWAFDWNGTKKLRIIDRVVRDVNSSSHTKQYQEIGGGLYPDAMIASLCSIKQFLIDGE